VVVVANAMCSRYVIQVGGRRSEKSGGSGRWGQTKRPKTQGNEKIKIGVYNVEGRGRGMGGRCDSSEREKRDESVTMHLIRSISQMSADSKLLLAIFFEK